MTPAQASGHPNFVTDVPVQGPTDEGLRAADCWFAQNRLPAQPACADCEGPIPMWARQSISHVRGQSSGIGERISFGGRGVLGFSLAAAGDPDVWTKLTTEQQTWIVQTLSKFNDLIVKSTGTTCPTWGPSITAAGGCFQHWFNAAKMGMTKPDGSPIVLRTDGVFDQDTLDVLRTAVGLHPKDFPTPFPGTTLPGETGTGEKKLSTGAMVGIGVAGATVLGGIVYAATRKRGGGRRKSRR